MMNRVNIIDLDSPAPEVETEGLPEALEVVSLSDSEESGDSESEEESGEETNDSEEEESDDEYYDSYSPEEISALKKSMRRMMKRLNLEEGETTLYDALKELGYEDIYGLYFEDPHDVEDLSRLMGKRAKRTSSFIGELYDANLLGELFNELSLTDDVKQEVERMKKSLAVIRSHYEELDDMKRNIQTMIEKLLCR